MHTWDQTFINPTALAFTLVMGLAMIVLPRKYAPIPMLLVATYITLGQRVVILGLDFTMFRILVLFGWVRILFRGELRQVRLNSIDKAILGFAACNLIAYSLLWLTVGAVVYKLGQTFNTIGLYFLFRALIWDLGDLRLLLRSIVIVIVPLAFAMYWEHLTQRNLFSIFGGVPEFTLIRDGKLRAQGPFAHPILAGTLGASLVPIFIGIWKRQKLLATAGLFSGFMIAFSSSSSGPLFTLLAGLVGMFAWPLRRRMRTVRWTLFVSLVCLHLVMRAPVWALIGRAANILGQGTGWHRVELINQAVGRFGDWFLIGTKSTAAWGYYLFDITNQYIQVGVDGGVVTLGFFIAVIAYSFKAVGSCIKRSGFAEKHPEQFLIWALGASLFSHVISFISVSYFDQIIVYWFLLLAVISSIAGKALPFVKRSSEQESPTGRPVFAASE